MKVIEFFLMWFSKSGHEICEKLITLVSAVHI